MSVTFEGSFMMSTSMTEPKKAAKKLKRPELDPGSHHYPSWVQYYESLIKIITGDIRIETYYKNKMESQGVLDPTEEEDVKQPD